MGRPKKSALVATGKTGKKEKVVRLEQEEKLKLDRDDLIVPEWLQNNSIASGEFERVVNEAACIDLLDNLDLSILAIYCNAYSNYVECTEMIAKNGCVEPGKDGPGKISPYVNAQIKYAEIIFKCSSKLGLAATDRLKLIVPKKDETETNKYLKYIK